MNGPASIVDAQLEHLLAQLEKHRTARCEEILAQARSVAAEEIRQAWARGRERLHLAVLDTREQARLQLASAAAQRHTRERQLRQQQDRALLERAWQPLQETLQRRWQDRATRRQWIDQLLSQAARLLMDTNWQIEHPEDWPTGERVDVEARMVELHGYVPVFVAQPAIRAGLRISAGDTQIDGTIDGLLHDRSHIESILLDRLNECRKELKTAAGSVEK